MDIWNLLTNGKRGYQIYNYDDEYFTVSVNDFFGNPLEEWECDQLKGLLEFLKDKMPEILSNT